MSGVPRKRVSKKTAKGTGCFENIDVIVLWLFYSNLNHLSSNFVHQKKRYGTKTRNWRLDYQIVSKDHNQFMTNIDCKSLKSTNQSFLIEWLQ